ncbi:MAG: zinc-ribbon domain-containing protein [Desulfovibrionaceae bacterium]
MHITCPQCDFSRNIPDEKIPARSELATCPKCGNKFRFRTLDSGDFAFAAPDWNQDAEDSSAFQPEQEQHPDEDKLFFTTRPQDDPAGEEDENGIPLVPVPFEDLENFGFFPGMAQTLKRAMFTPRLFFEVMPLKGIARPMVFAVLLFELSMILDLLWQIGGLPLLSEFSQDLAMLDPDAAANLDPSVIFVMMPLLFVFNMFLTTALLHGVLLLFRAAPRGYEATFRALAYSYAPLILSVFPYGYLVGWIWSLAISIIGCRAIHRTQGWRVALAFASVVLIMVLLVFMPVLLGMKA